jgi:hypothetical protein
MVRESIYDGLDNGVAMNKNDETLGGGLSVPRNIN